MANHASRFGRRGQGGRPSHRSKRRGQFVHPDARVSSTVVVEQQRLDELWEELIDPSERVFVKLDVQGYEDRVLDGARICLDHWRGMQVEMSLVPLYSGGAQFDAIMAFAKAAGFSLMSLDAGFWDKSTFFREART